MLKFIPKNVYWVRWAAIIFLNNDYVYFIFVSECNMDDSQRGVLKLNVAIAGEFSMGSFKDK